MDQGGFRVAYRKALALAVALSGLLLLSAPVVDAHPPSRGQGRGGVIVGGYYNPYLFNPYLGFGWGGYPYAYGYGYSLYGYGYGYGRPAAPSSSARFQVSPKEAEVFVDGYRAGRVDDFDGTFQRLNVEPGPHEVTLFLSGYRTATEKIYFAEGSTIKLRQTLEKLGPGESSTPPPPAPPRRRSRGGRADAGDFDSEGRAARDSR
jgi:hypothetical protein